MLSGFRAFDLADERGLFCGKVLADCGADVIKVEKPGGDPARRLGPFYQDIPHSERSLFWFSYNAGKRGITLNLESADGQDIFKRLVEGADFVVESFDPGYMEWLGLGYAQLSEINPRLIMASITPFGQNGPNKDYRSSDIVAMATGGLMSIMGDPDHPPVRCSVEQAYLNAGLQAAAGMMIASYYRELTGEGQYVDSSIQESVALTLWYVLPWWDVGKAIRKREGHLLVRGSGPKPSAIFPCRDGYVAWRIYTGQQGGLTYPVVAMMQSEGMGEELKDIRWEEVDFGSLGQQELDRMEKAFAEFFRRHTKVELQEKAVQSGAVLMPVTNPQDIFEDKQLAAREFWSDVYYPELGVSLGQAGLPFKINGASRKISRRAPLIGEHNKEIYQGELGFSDEELVLLKQANVI